MLTVGIRGIVGRCLIHDRVRIAVTRLRLQSVFPSLGDTVMGEETSRLASCKLMTAIVIIFGIGYKCEFSLPRIERLKAANNRDGQQYEGAENVVKVVFQHFVRDITSASAPPQKG